MDSNTNNLIAMTCEQVEDELSGYLDDVLDPQLRRSVETHLETCDRCQMILADFRRNDALIKALPFIEPPADMRERFFNSPRYHKLAQANTRRSIITPLTAALAAAAVLVLALGGTLLLRQGILASQQVNKSGTTTTIGNNGGATPLSAGPRLVYERAGALWSAPASGVGLPRQLTPAGIQVAGWSVSPSGRMVVYIDALTGSVHTIRSDALSDTVVGTVTGGQSPAANFWASPAGVSVAGGLAWSPDNTRIAYVAQHGAGVTLHVMNATGAADAVAQGNSVGALGHPLWSADSLAIAYTATTAAGAQAVWVYNVATGAALPVATHADPNDASAVVDQLAWLPGATPAAITWSARDQDTVTGIFRADATSRDAAIRLTPEGSSYTAADVSASGAWLLASGAHLSLIANGQTTPLEVMTLAHPVTLVRWAPSGQIAAVMAGDALALLTSDHHLVVVARGLPAKSVVAWAPDSASLAWQSGSGIMMAKIHQNAASSPKAIAQGTALGVVWSPNGEVIAVRSASGLALVTADGAQTRATDSHAANGGQFAWSLAG